MSTSGSGGKRYGGPWYAEFRQRLIFEGDARRSNGTVTHRLRREGKTGMIEYRFCVDVPHYEQRHVTVRFEDGSKIPKVTADGPTGRDASPHRYEGERLCIWDPKDPPSKKWVWDDGFTALIAHVTVHLFREAWWRETGEWLGPEAQHSVNRPQVPAEGTAPRKVEG